MSYPKVEPCSSCNDQPDQDHSGTCSTCHKNGWDQEPQGAQDGCKRAALAELVQTIDSGSSADYRALQEHQVMRNARASLATQPAAPVAAGEPVAWIYDTPNNGRQYSDKRLDHYWWDMLKDSYVKGVPLYAAPPAAAHGDEVLLKLFNQYKSLADSGDAGFWSLEKDTEAGKVAAQYLKSKGLIE